MTCKDCKKWKQCKSSAKSDKYSGYNWHLMIVDEQTEHLMIHAQCRKEMSEEELEAYLDRFIIGMEGNANDPQP